MVIELGRGKTSLLQFWLEFIEQGTEFKSVTLSTLSDHLVHFIAFSDSAGRQEAVRRVGKKENKLPKKWVRR